MSEMITMLQIAAVIAAGILVAIIWCRVIFGLFELALKARFPEEEKWPAARGEEPPR